MRIFRFVLLMMFTASVPARMGAQLLVEDFFADGGTTQGADPLDVRWLASGGTFTVVTDELLNPVYPHRAAELFIDNSVTQEKDEYLSFRLPEAVTLEVGEALELHYRLRIVGGPPRTDDSRTGVAFAFHPNESRLSPWSDPENRELFFFTSFGREGTLGSIRRSAGVQFLNSHLHLASNLHSVSLGDQPGEVAFVVERLSDIQTRVRYRLNQGPWQEALVDAEALPTVNQIHFRFRRATNAPLERFRISAVRVVRKEADLTPRAPQSWWVAPQGNDGSTGESMENAFASIGRALLWARAGDTVWVREGVYRETLQPGQSGTEEEPIRIRAYGSPLQPEPVTVSAFSPLIPGEGGVGTWEQHDGHIWRIQLPAGLPLPLGRNLLKMDGTVLKPARWPTATGPVDFDRRNMTEATAGSVDLETRGPQPPYPAHQDNFVDAAYTAAALAAFPENALAGARIDLCTGHNWWHKTGVVTGNSGDIVHFRFRFEFGWNHDLDTPKHADRFAIWGTLAVLDSPGEFFVDVEGINGPQNMLYVWLPDSGTPDGRAWELRTRSITFQAMTQQHIQVENLRFFGGRVQTGADSAQVTFDGVEVQLGAFNTDQLRHDDQVAVLLDGTGHRFHRGWVRDTEGRSIYPRGEGHQVTETVIENSTSHSLSLDSLVRGEASWNTAFNSGNTIVAIGAYDSRIRFNHVYHAGMRITDIALMNTWDSGDMGGTEIAYNWAHSNLAPWSYELRWWGGQGIRLDSGGAPRGCSNALIHHNVVWGTTSRSGITAWGLEEGMERYGDSRIFVFHNTIDQDLVFGGRGSNAGTVAKRNIAVEFRDAVNSLDGATVVDNLFRVNEVSGNLRGLPEFVSPGNRNYRLRPDSPAWDAGTPIPGITEPGPYAYLGAFNPAADPWWPGARIRPRDLHALTAGIETDALGTHRLIVRDAPRGRTFPESFTVSLDGQILSQPLVVYCFDTHTVAAHLELSALPESPSAAFSVSLDGEDFFIPDQATVEVPQARPEAAGPLVTTPEDGGTLTVSLPSPPPHLFRRFPLSFSGLNSHDLTRDAIPWMVDTRDWVDLGMAPDGRDLRILAADGVTPLRFHLETPLGRENTLIWLLRDAETLTAERVASFEDRSMLFLAFGDGAELHLDDPTVLTDSFPVLSHPDRLLHLVATDLLPQHSGGDAVAAWPDRGPQPATVIAPSDAARPVLEDSPVAGLPGVRFDGIGNHLFVNGAAGLGGGSARFVAVYRNPDPGTTRWQRLFSGRANTDGTDWETGAAGIIHQQDGNPVPHETARILDLNRQGEFSFEHFTLGRRSLADHEWFRGELAELFVFSGALEGPPRDALIRYLRRKYNIDPRPVGAVQVEAVRPQMEILLDGEPLEGWFLDAEGRLQIPLPPRESEPGLQPAALDVQIRMPDGSWISLPQSVVLASAPDVWRMQHFGIDAVLNPSPEDAAIDWLADPDEDGVPNLLEFALGTDPRSPTPLPLLSLHPWGPDQIRLQFPELSDAVDIFLEHSEDLQTWELLEDQAPFDPIALPPAIGFWRLRVQLRP